jgi:hypothetical protein
MKNYITWFKAAAIFQLIFGIIHAATLFISQQPNNETEKQLFTLMETYRFDLGAGFHRTMGELLLVFSASLCLLYLFGGLINWYLLRKTTVPETMKGVITINLVIFGICFGLTVAFAFLLPIVLTGLVFMFLIISRFLVRNSN